MGRLESHPLEPPSPVARRSREPALMVSHHTGTKEEASRTRRPCSQSSASANGASKQLSNRYNREQDATPKEARAPKAQAKEFSHTINKGRGAVPPPRERRRRKRPGRKLSQPGTRPKLHSSASAGGASDEPRLPHNHGPRPAHPNARPSQHPGCKWRSSSALRTPISASAGPRNRSTRRGRWVPPSETIV